MAEITPVSVNDNRDRAKTSWESAVVGDTFVAAGLGQYPDKTLQILGTLDGATAGLEGSNDGGTTWVDLTLDGATAIDGTGMFWIWESPVLVRPKLTGGASGTALSWIISYSTLS